MKLRERTMRGRREKAQQGFVSGGRVPYGYRYLGKREGKRGELVVNGKEAAVVRRIFRMASEGVSLLEIARKLTAEGVPTANGAAWSKPVIAQMLKNTTYMGEARYNRTTRAEPKRRRKPEPAGKSKKTSAKLRPESEWIRVKTPAIISRDLFSRLRETMERGRHANSGRPSNRYLLRGLLFCAKCGWPLYTFPNRNRPFARCGNVDRLTGKRRSDAERVWVADAEAFVLGEVELMKYDPDRISRLAEEAHARTIADSRNAGATAGGSKRRSRS